MKINHIISESELDEAIPFTKKWKAQKSLAKKSQQSINNEILKMEVELKDFMRSSQVKVATPKVVLDYLTKKGLGQVGQEVIKNFVTGSQKMQNVAGAAGKLVGKGLSKLGIAANNAPPSTPPATDPSTQQTTRTSNKPPATNNADTDSYEKFKGQIRQVQSGNKPLPAKMSSSIEADLAKLAKGDKESGSFAAQKILKFANAGYNVSGLSSKWTASSKAGERFLTQSIFIAISKMLQEHGLDWSNLGINLRLVENVSGVYISLLKESKLDEQVAMDTPLSARDVKNILKQSIEKGKSANLSKSKFASDTSTAPAGTPPASGQGAPNITDFINSLTPQQKAQLKAAL